MKTRSRQFGVIAFLFLSLFVTVQAFGRTLGFPFSDSTFVVRDSLVHSPVHEMDSIVIVAENITHYADRDVVRITKDMRKGARNTAQMLGNIPGIDCNYADNSLTYYGSGNILILVDSLEKPADYIKEIHHMRYDKVDIVPHPSGKYSGYDVLINLHTKPDYEGYEGNASNYVRILPGDGNGRGKNLTKDNAAASFTYTKNRWNFVGRYNYKFSQGGFANIDETNVYHVNNYKETVLNPRSKDYYYRYHNLYVAVDYEINKDHSLSLSYNYSTDNSEDASDKAVERQWMDTGVRDTIMRHTGLDINSNRHTIGLYYRGRTGVWRYTLDFNYINDGWDSDELYSQSSGYSSDYLHRNHMDYAWVRTEVNRPFFNDHFYVSGGYNFTWKDYEQKDRPTGSQLSKNSFWRNELWTWMSYRFSRNTELSFSASAELVKTESPSYRDNSMLYKFGGGFFHRWNKDIWMRLGYWYNVSYPQLDQVTEFGYFSDSLTWHQGNPSLRTNITHSGNIWIDFFNLFNIRAGYDHSPNRFSDIIGSAYGVLPSGQKGYYITYMPQNTSYSNFWTSFYIFKRIKDFTLSASLGYSTTTSKYKDYKNTNSGFNGNVSVRYYNEKYSTTALCRYVYNNAYMAFVQGKVTRRMDYFSLLVSKDFLNRKLSASLGWILPLSFQKQRYKETVDSEALSKNITHYIGESNRNAIELTVAYRFNGGKSVRRYNRMMQSEK